MYLIKMFDLVGAIFTNPLRSSQETHVKPICKGLELRGWDITAPRVQSLSGSFVGFV